MLYVGRAFVWSEKCQRKNTPIYSKDNENIFKKVGSQNVYIQLSDSFIYDEFVFLKF